MANNGHAGGGSGTQPDHRTYIAALILSGVYLVLAIFLLFYGLYVNPPGNNWDHAYAIFTNIATAGFTAIGVLLGTAVQQTNVANAQSQAGQARANEAEAKIKEAAQAVIHEASAGDHAAAAPMRFSPALVRLQALVSQ